MAQRGPGSGRSRGGLRGGGASTRSDAGIRKRSPAPPRVDRDGDLDMDAPVSRGRGRGAPRAARGNPFSRAPLRGGSTRNTINPDQAHKAASRGVDIGDALRGTKSRGRDNGALKEVHGNQRGAKEEELVVKGWQDSKAASNAGGGVEELLSWLQRKARLHAGDLRKSHIKAGGELHILVKAQNVESVLRLNTWEFAGAKVTIEKSQNSQSDSGLTSAQIKDKMTSMLNRRYSSTTKLLDLTALGNDPDFANTGMFETHTTESKFFPALMAVCNNQFKSAQDKRHSILSVTLANNNLPTVKTVVDLAYTLPDLKNLDLSNNALTNLESLEPWRRRFRKLDHLILSGNPLEANVPNYQQEIMQWYPTLRTLNSTPVRTDVEVALHLNQHLPIPTKAPVFLDNGGVGENFVKHFFPAYDTDRASLLNSFYDASSKFSMSVNTSAPRADDQSTPSWDRYIKQSRNLKKLTHLNARMSRMYQGVDRIREAWASLPPTQHPALVAISDKWCVECHPMPGLPAAAGQASNDVSGLIVMVHGDFHEVDPSNGQTTHQRSFDRTFILSPGAGLGGIRVVNDIMMVRAYGGHEAWKPEDDPTGPPQQPVQPVPAVSAVIQPSLPDGFGIAGLGKTEEEAQKELMALELSKATRLTLNYSIMCLEQVNWNLQQAGLAFEEAKATLPAEAFF